MTIRTARVAILVILLVVVPTGASLSALSASSVSSVVQSGLTSSSTPDATSAPTLAPTPPSVPITTDPATTFDTPAPPVLVAAPPVANSDQYMVGYRGDLPTALLEAVGVTVDALHPDAGFALVSTRDPSLLTSLVDLVPGLVYVARNGATFSDGSTWDAAQWDAATWDGATWDSSNWDASHWDGATWDAATWDAAAWDAATWDASTWDASHWDGSQWDATTGPLRDPGYGNEWHLGAIHAPDAWNKTTAFHTMTICSVDSGVNYTHPDLVRNMKRLADGSYGYDFVNNDKDPMDDGGHGTHIAGIAAATMGNGHGVAGVSQAYVVSAKVINATGYGTEANLALGIRWCVDSGGAKIIMLALHTEGDNQGVHDAVKYAKNKGALILAASGNAGNVCDDCVAYPAAYNEATAVGASAPDGTRAPFSNGGEKLRFLAPGVQIAGPAPGGRYAVGSGTSQATGVAAGAAALVWAAKPSLNADGVRNALSSYAKDAGAPGDDIEYGSGLLRLDLTMRGLKLIP